MALGTTTWLQAAPVVAVAVLLVVLPGALGARLAGLRWATALGTGSVLTTTALALGGVVAGQLGIGWGVPMLAASVAVLLAACALVGFVLRSRPEPSPAEATDAADRRDAADDAGGVADGSPWSLLAGAALALVVAVLVVVPATGRPTNFPQSPDTIYHLGTIQWMVAGGDISSLHAGGFASLSGTGFYPAAFHGIGATVAMLTGASAVVAASSVALALAGVVWPLGLVVLARRLFGPTLTTTVVAALASVAFAAFPFWLMGYGVLWPNLYGQALLPALLALLLAATGGPARARSALLVVAGLPGLALAHPNAFIAFALVGTLVVVLALLRGAGSLWSTRRGAALARLGSAVVVVGVAGAVWAVATKLATSMRISNPAGPEMPTRDGVIDALFFAARGLTPLWVGGGLVVIGLLVLLVRRRHLWVVLAHLGVTALYLLIALVDTKTTRLLTWPWYNNGPRLAALMVLTGALLTTAALTTVTDLVAWVRRRRVDRSGSSGEALGGRPTATGLAATAVVALAFVAATAGVGIGASRDALHPYFSAPADHAWASEADLEALKTLGAKVPAGAVVAANPWQGGSYLYLTSDRRLLFPTEKAWTEGDRALLGSDLDRAADDPAVCDAARRQKVRYVLVGGSSQTRSKGQERRYEGVDGVADAAGFSLVDKAGDYALYRLDACR